MNPNKINRNAFVFAIIMTFILFFAANFMLHDTARVAHTECKGLFCVQNK